MVENVLYVSGGVSNGEDQTQQSRISSWDPVLQTWTRAGELRENRKYHGAVAVPSDVVECAALP